MSCQCADINDPAHREPSNTSGALTAICERAWRTTTIGMRPPDSVHTASLAAASCPPHHCGASPMAVAEWLPSDRPLTDAARGRTKLQRATLRRMPTGAARGRPAALGVQCLHCGTLPCARMISAQVECRLRSTIAAHTDGVAVECTSSNAIGRAFARPTCSLVRHDAEGARLHVSDVAIVRLSGVSLRHLYECPILPRVAYTFIYCA